MLYYNCQRLNIKINSQCFVWGNISTGLIDSKVKGIEFFVFIIKSTKFFMVIGLSALQDTYARLLINLFFLIALITLGSKNSHNERKCKHYIE